MNKMLIGGIVIIVGGIVGWYTFRNEGVKLPGMQIGSINTIPVPSGTNGSDVAITDESTMVGTEKGGIAQEAVVTYTDAGYAPKEITVKKGTTVTFRNESVSGMWTASGTHPTHKLLPGFDQLKSVMKGGTYEYTFLKVGRWQYHNHLKSTDGGMVIVVE